MIMDIFPKRCLENNFFLIIAFINWLAFHEKNCYCILETKLQFFQIQVKS